MFYGTYFYSVFHQHGAAGGIAYVLCYGIDYWLSFKVNSLDFVPVVVRCRIECHRQVYSGVKAFPV